MIGREVRIIFWILATSLVLPFPSLAQSDSPKPKVSSHPLTVEQIAVYRAVLEDYTKGADGALNLAKETELLDRPISSDVCIKGIDLEAAGNSALVVHQFSAETLGPKVVVVDPDRQSVQIEENDPQKLVKKAIDKGQVSNKQLDDSVKRAFETGLFTLSEIVLDKRHRHAVVAYSFVCGSLCGNGNTLVLNKVGQKWKVDHMCGGWVS